MIVIKYTSLASYTKQLSLLFYRCSDNVIHSLGDTRLPILFNKHEKLLDVIVNKQIPTGKFAYLSVNDEHSIATKPVEFLSQFTQDDDVYVLVPLISMVDRLKSLLLRSSAGDCGTDVDCYVRNAYRIHANSMLAQKGVTFDDSHVTFESVILLDQLEQLVQLHNDKKITLIFVSKDTMLHHPDKILARLDISGDNVWVDGGKAATMTRRVKKQITWEASTNLRAVLNEHAEKIDRRTAEIEQLITDNAIEVL